MGKYAVTWIKAWSETGTEIIEADSAEWAEDFVLDHIEEYGGQVIEHDNETEVKEITSDEEGGF